MYGMLQKVKMCAKTLYILLLKKGVNYLLVEVFQRILFENIVLFNEISSDGKILLIACYGHYNFNDRALAPLQKVLILNLFDILQTDCSTKLSLVTILWQFYI